MVDLPYIDFHVELAEPAPVSVNKLYVSTRDGKRFLSKDGRNYKDALRTAVVEAVSPLDWQSAVEGVYKNMAWVCLSIELRVDDLYNASWKPDGGLTKSGASRSPYKKRDATNYIKLIEDAVVEGTGIDDSAHLAVSVRKIQDARPRVVIHYEVYESG